MLHTPHIFLGLLLAACGDKDDGTFGSGSGDADDGGADDTGATGTGDTDGGTVDCAPVFVDFEGTVATASGTPFGRDDLRGAVVTGSFAWDPCVDDSDDRESVGVYAHDGTSAFSAALDDLTVEGSGDATVEIVVAGSGFRFQDGGDGRTMTVDGEAASLELGIYTAAADSSAFTDDSLPDPEFLDASVAHTFSIDDADGGVLVQWDRLSVR